MVYYKQPTPICRFWLRIKFNSTAAGRSGQYHPSQQPVSHVRAVGAFDAMHVYLLHNMTVGSIGAFIAMQGT
jgi:hypothetical protein